MSRREARTVPVRTCAGSGKLPELPRCTRLDQRVLAEGFSSALVRRMPRVRPRINQRAIGCADHRSELPELSHQGSRDQQSLGSAVAQVGDGTKSEDTTSCFEQWSGAGDETSIWAIFGI